jgi:PAP2 superfamily
MKKKQLIRISLTLIAVAATAAFAKSSHFYLPAAISLYFALTLIGVTLICWRLTRSWRIVFWTLVAGAGVASELAASEHALSLVSTLSSLGLGSLLVIAVRAVWTEGDEHARLTAGFAGAFLLLASEYFGLNLLMWTQNPNSKVLDLYLYSFDASLHIPLSFLAGQAWQRWGWLNITGVLFYGGLFIPVAVIYAGLLMRDRQKAFEALASFVLTAPVGVLFYRVFPALGPTYLFLDRFPWHPLAFSEASRLFVEPVPLQGLRNAMPSLHMTWALLAFWWSRTLSRWDRLLAALFVVFTIVATMGTGEHYLIDLIVACPFALTIYYFCSFSLSWKDYRRVRACLYGLLATLGWLAALRYETRVFWISPVIPWITCILTIGLVGFLRGVPWFARDHVAVPVATDLRIQSKDLAEREA